MRPVRRYRFPSATKIVIALAVLAAVFAGTATSAAVYAIVRVNENANDARDAARQACMRSRTFGPALADAYARYQILDPDQLAAYRATIPDSCP